ncbi:MAG: hypothetical protein IPP73_12585 [Chitinophagaceae bacterium]|nr:hypothetical protein [Chitinophagaceae bacterium]
MIPDDAITPYAPLLPVGASVKTVTVEAGGIINSANAATLSLTGSNDVWNMETNGLFNAGNSTVTISNTSAVSSITGNSDFYNLTVATGASLRQANNSRIGVAGTLTLQGTGTLDAVSNTNTIDFNGTGNQTIPALDYFNLVLSGARTTNSITLASSGTIGVFGTFTPSATFTSGNDTVSSSTVSLNGTLGAQIFSASFGFNNLTINNTSGVSISADQTVAGTLTFTSGKITTGTYKVILGSSSPCTSGTVSGAGSGKYIYGNLRRYVTNTADPVIGFDIGDGNNYTPVSVAFTGTTSGCGYIDAQTSVAQPPVESGLSQTKYINRKWTLTNTGVSGFTAFSSTFTFVAGDKVGSPNTAALVVRRYNGSAWSNTTNGTRAALSTQCTGLTGFGEFALGEDECAGTLLWFGGTSTDWNDGANWCSGSVPRIN